MRKEFEPHRELLVNLEEALVEVANEDEMAVQSGDEFDEYIPEETTKPAELEDFVKKAKKAAATACQQKLKTLSSEELRKGIRMMNAGQRRIFDDIIERLWCQEAEK